MTHETGDVGGGAQGGRRRRCGGRAFTLLEMLVVLVVMGVIAGMAVPRFANSLAVQRVNAASRRIVVDLSFARRHARLVSAEQTVQFTVTDDTYTFDGVPDPDHAGQEYTVSLAREPYRASIISADFGGDDEITFNIYGVPDSAGTVVVQAGSHAKTITVDDTTGRATVTD